MVSNEVLASLLWSIWKMRSAHIFQQRRLDPSNLINLAIAEHECFKKRNSDGKPTREHRAQSTPSWSPTVENTWEINIDGSKTKTTPDGAVFGVVQDARGALIHGFTSNVRARSPQATETLAILRGLQFVGEAPKQNNSWSTGSSVPHC